MMTSRLTRRSFGFYLTRAAQRWRAMLHERFCAAGYPEMRPTYGAVLVPLFEEDGLRLGTLAHRSGLSKQTMTTLIRQIEDIGMIERRTDPSDRRATRVFLTAKAHRFRAVAERALADLDAMALALAAPGDIAPVARWLEKMAHMENTMDHNP
jgi:DNA-binding MarR family transcriptional regulator